MSEDSGTVAVDYSGRGLNGAYTGVTFGQTGIGDGLACPLFDGAGDFNNVYSAAMNTAFNGQLFSFLLWASVASAVVWGDGTADSFIRFEVDASNITYIRKNTVSNGLRFHYLAGGTTVAVLDTSLNGSLDFFHAAMTVSLAADEMKAYLNGSQIGTTQTGLGIWSGNLDTNRACIGATSITPVEVTNGRLAHVAIVNRVATSAEIGSLAMI